jgi:hypothetical protein
MFVEWMSVPAASSAFCIVVSTPLGISATVTTHVFGISHVCDLSKWLDSELRWCRGVVVGRVVGGRIVVGGRCDLSESSGKTWHGPCSHHPKHEPWITTSEMQNYAKYKVGSHNEYCADS